MKAGREAVIVGVAEAPLAAGKLADRDVNVLGAQARVAVRALAEAGLTLADVDGLLTSGSWGVPGPGRFPTMTLGEYLGIEPTFFDSTSVGGASFEAHAAHAAMAIETGYCEVALITYGSTQRSDRSRALGSRGDGLTSQFEAPFGLPLPVGAYALAAQRHMHQYGTTSEQLAEIVVASRGWAALNPAATARDPLTIDNVLASPMISSPLRRLDCCLVTDGAGAIVLTSARRAESAATLPVRVLGSSEAHSHTHIAAMPDLTLPPAYRTGPEALRRSGVSIGDVDVAMIYDSFTITVLLTLEALGFCGRGEGGAFVEGGSIAPGGSLPVNPNGGGLSSSHPGMYGIFLLIEAVRQLRGEADARQVAGAEVALVSGTGAVLSSAATCVLARG